MPSKKQWLIIVLASLYGFVSVTGGLAVRTGGAVGLFVVSFAIVAGYNGVDFLDYVRR